MANGYKIANFGGQPEDIQNRSEGTLFQHVELDWEGPFEWEKGNHAPVDHDEPCLYVLQHEHAKSARKMTLLYVGLTISPKRRFLNHPTALDIVGRRGKAYLSYAVVNFKGRNKEARTKYTLEQVEHLLIWALWPTLENDKKMFTLPGMGSNGGTAWQISNTGHRFHGQMPREIVYPWMIVKPGRDRSAR